jgi:hypothetical protein
VSPCASSGLDCFARCSLSGAQQTTRTLGLLAAHS